MERQLTANLRTSTSVVDFGGLDSSIISILRGGIIMSIGDFPKSLSRATLVSRDNVSREIGRTQKWCDMPLVAD